MVELTVLAEELLADTKKGHIAFVMFGVVCMLF